MAKARQMRMLNDEEKLTIMNQSITAADEQGLDFEVVFSALLDAYIAQKEQQQSFDVEPEMDMTPAEDFEQQQSFDVESEMDMTPAEEFREQDDFDVDMTPAEEFREQDDFDVDMTPAEPVMSDEQRVTVRQQLKEYFQRKRDELLSKIGAIKGVTPGMILDAKDGIITDPDKYFDGTYADAEVREFVGQLNANSRASYYDNLMLASDDELETMRDSTVGLYAELAEEGLAEKDYWDKEDKLHPEKDVWNMQHQPTITFDNLVAMRGRLGRHITGVTSPTGYGSDPLGFDEFYSEARERVGKGKSHTKNLFDQALSKVRENIEKLSHMTSSEFRDFKVSQMTLSDDEKSYFDEQRNNVVRSYGLSDDEDSFTDERGYEGFGMNK